MPPDMRPEAHGEDLPPAAAGMETQPKAPPPEQRPPEEQRPEQQQTQTRQQQPPTFLPVLELLTTFCKNQVDPLELVLSDPSEDISEHKMGMVRRAWRTQEQLLQQLTQILEAAEVGDTAKLHLDQVVACSQSTSLRMNRNGLLLQCRDVLQKMRETKNLVLLLPHVGASVHKNNKVYLCSRQS